jgi:hypothetical protein
MRESTARFYSLLFLITFLEATPNLPRDHLRHVYFFKFSQNITAAETARAINALYGKGTTTHMTVNNWYHRFREGDISLEDKTRSGWPTDFDTEALLISLKENSW